MNESRRASLRDAIMHLQNAESTIERVRDEEQDSMDNPGGREQPGASNEQLNYGGGMNFLLSFRFT